jgi:hypothetical protein
MSKMAVFHYTYFVRTFNIGSHRTYAAKRTSVINADIEGEGLWIGEDSNAKLRFSTSCVCKSRAKILAGELLRWKSFAGFP